MIIIKSLWRKSVFFFKVEQLKLKLKSKSHYRLFHCMLQLIDTNWMRMRAESFDSSTVFTDCEKLRWREKKNVCECRSLFR